MTAKGKSKSAKKRTHSQSDSGSESEHELFYYCNDRVQLMKEVIKILKLKKIKALAPPGIKKMDMEEMNTLLLEELLGISNKRLKKVLEGQNADDESSSSDEAEVDVISLESISDDEICFVDETTDDMSYKKTKAKCRHRKHRVKKEKNETNMKTEVKTEKDKTKADKNEKIDKPSGLENEKLLSVLELLELQARARAIRSQLALEAENKAKEAAEAQKDTQNLDDSDDAIIIETPTVNEIVISSSDSENETVENNKDTSEKQVEPENDITEIENIIESAGQLIKEKTPSETMETKENHENKQNHKKIKLIRSILVEPSTSTTLNAFNQSEEKTQENDVNLNDIPLPETSNNQEVNEDVSENPENSKTAESNVKTVLTDEENTTSNNEQNSTKNEQIEEKPTNKLVMIDPDDETDVIQLDIVEIEGIDD